MKQHRYTNLFWHLLFLDMTYLFLRLGGLESLDLITHGFFLGLCMVVLARHGRPNRIPKTLLLLIALVLLVALVQMIPLPDPLFRVLAPVKHQLGQTIGTIYPNLEHGTAITMIPQLHGLKLASLVLDMVMICLMVMAGLPSRRVVDFWILVLAFCLGVLAVLSGRELIPESGWLSIYKDTIGGLYNSNQFATVAVMLLALLMQLIFRKSVAILTLFRPGHESDPPQLLAHLLWLIPTLTGLGLMVSGFAYAWSRSGIFVLAIVFCCFWGFLGLNLFLRRKRVSPWKILAALTLPLLFAIPLLFTVNLGGIAKLSSEGLEVGNRIGYYRVGLSYLKEWPLLGMGMGSTESLLDPVAPKRPMFSKNVRKYHNDYLEVTAELGLVGIGCLLWFFVFLAKAYASGLGEERRSELWFIAATISGLIGFAAHSAISFPLRIAAIRVFVLVFAFLAYRICEGNDPKRTKGLAALGLLAPFLLISMITIGSLVLSAAKIGDQTNPYLSDDVRSGRLFQADLHQAGAGISQLLSPDVTLETVKAEIPKIRAELHRYLRNQPFSLKALNQLFILDVFDLRMANPTFNQQAYQALKTKAERLRELGRDANIQSRSSLFFLYSVFEQDLDPEEKREYQRFRRSIWYKLNKQKEKIEAEQADHANQE